MKKSFALASVGVLAAPVLLVAPVLGAGPGAAAERHDHRVVGWVSCNPGANGMLTYKPRQHVLSCADANSGLRKLTWSSWNSKSATGAGTYYWNDCEPNCAAGTNHTSKATVELKAPKVQKGEKVFTRIVVKYTDEDGNLQVDRMDSVPYLG
jgi:hypothetical protein